MFKLNISHSRGGGTNHPLFSFKSRQQGYNNIQSPMKAAFLMQASSPSKNLSPLKTQTPQRMNQPRSPILLSRRQDGYYSGTKQLSPFSKRQQQRQHQNDTTQQQRNISFTNLIRKNSNTCQSPHSLHPLQFSTQQNYLQSDRSNTNIRQQTNLFKKLASMLQSNKVNNNNNISFTKNNSVLSENNSVKRMPQSCKNASNNNINNKKIIFKNVLTIESIQSPQDCRYEDDYRRDDKGVEIVGYEEYQHMDLRVMQKKMSKNQWSEPKMQKKSSQRHNEDDTLTFKKIQLTNDIQKQQQPKTIDFHLTNSFGTTALKNQLSPTAKKPLINPFQQITQPINSINTNTNLNVNNDLSLSSSLHSITQSLSGESVFASLQMLLEKVDVKQSQSSRMKENQSINISIVSDGQASELDMEPFFEGKK